VITREYRYNYKGEWSGTFTGLGWKAIIAGKNVDHWRGWKPRTATGDVRFTYDLGRRADDSRTHYDGQTRLHYLNGRV